MTSLFFDLFARDHASKEFDKMARKVRATAKELDDFSNRSTAAFTRTAKSLSNMSAAATALQGVGSIAGSLVGVLGLLPAAAAAAGAGFAALAVGVHGFTEGFKQIADSSKISGGVSNAADAAVQSARHIEDAQRGLQRAVRGTKDAEETLARAQRDALDAQKELTRAREDAAEKLDDLNRSAAGAALDQEAAVLAVQRAYEQLDQATRNGASGLDLAEAQLGVRQAEQALLDTQDRYADLQKEAAKANAAGVEGSDEVVNAQRGVEDAALGVQHAQQGVADASQEVLDAQRNLADAYRDAARSAASAGSSLAGMTAKFDGLSNNTKEAIRSILSLRGAWTDLQHSVADALFAGVGDEVKKLGGTYIPVLKQGLTGIAEEFNKGARSTADFLAQGKQVDSIRTIFGGSRDVARQFAQALAPLTSIFVDLATVGSQMLPGLIGGFGKAADKAAEFVRNARETGALRDWIQGGLDTLKKLGEVFGNLGSIIGSVFSGLNAGGKNFLDTLVTVTGKVRDFLQTSEAQQALKALGQALAAVSSVVTDVFLTGLKELAPVIVALAPGFAALAKQVGTILVDALKIAGPLLEAIAKGLADNIDWLGPLIIGLVAGAKAFALINTALVALKLEALSNPWLAIIAATIALATLIITHWDQIKAALAAAWDWIARTAGHVWEGIKKVIIDPITDTAKWIGDRVNDMVGFFIDMPGRIGRALASLAGLIAGVFKDVVNAVIDVLNWSLDHSINWVIRTANNITSVVGGGTIPTIPHIPRLHTGGKVPGMPGQESLFILQAGETVLPANYDWGPPASMQGGIGATGGGVAGQEVRVMLVPGPGAVGAVADLINNLVRTRQITAVRAA